VEYFLALFPVLTISMNFPIVGVTLCNNLRALLGWDADGVESTSRLVRVACFLSGAD